MGLNQFLSAVESKGYKTESAATEIDHNISGRQGKRIAILAFGASAGTAADAIYFMTAIKGVVNGAIASGASTVVMTAALTDPAANAAAANDQIAIEKTDGTFQFTNIATWTASTLTIVLSAALTGAVSDGAGFYNFGIAADGHPAYTLGAAAQATEQLETGLFYGGGRGYPMKIQLTNAVDSNSIDYVTIGFIPI